ncbi:hypothetical protein R3P38DRAFT_2785982 [Favolaschia claudopus]|uniref:Uncharacterized protein n=1 Tax=Favolaschia claudopus TaxID=2862362 RepID=A0AAW0AVU6_9AGAR
MKVVMLTFSLSEIIRCQNELAAAQTNLDEKKAVLDAATGRKKSGAATAHRHATTRHQRAIEHLEAAEAALKAFEGVSADELRARLEAEAQTQLHMADAAAAARKAEEEAAAAMRKAEEEAAAVRKAEEEAAAVRKAEEEAAAKRKVEEEAAAARKAEEEAAAAMRKAEEEAEEEAAAKRKADEEAAVEKRNIEEEAAMKKVNETNGKEAGGKKRKAGDKAPKKANGKPSNKNKNKKEDNGAEQKGKKKLKDKERTLHDIDNDTSDDAPIPKRQKPNPSVKKEDIKRLDQLREAIIYDLNTKQLSDDDWKQLDGRRIQVEQQLKEARDEAEDSTYDDEDLVNEDDDADDDKVERKFIDGCKMDIEEKWALSFMDHAQGLTTTFPKGPEEWRKDIERWSPSFLPSVYGTERQDVRSQKKYTIPATWRRLMRKVAEVAPESAYLSKALALHVLTTNAGQTKCRFHDSKRTTQGAQLVDGPALKGFFVVGVPYGPGAKKPESGFLDCGCYEKDALSEFLWFKTWTIKSANSKIEKEEGMKNDVLGARHRAFVNRALTIGTLLDIDDMYTTQFAWGTPEYNARLRRIQVDRMIGELNMYEGSGAKEVYVLSKAPNPE